MLYNLFTMLPLLKNLPILFFLILFASCNAPKFAPIDFDSRDYEFNDYIAYLYSQTNDLGLAKRQYSFVGEIEKMLKLKTVNEKPNAIISDAEWQEINETYKFKNAKNYILEKSKKHDIIIFNEDHNYPKHRHFVKSLLADLKKNNYKYLFLEGVGMMGEGQQFDTDMMVRGYATQRSGFYLREPQFGLLIRGASRLGFEILGYDEGSGSEREIEGAKNILAYWDKRNRNGKIAILCGWDHARETHTGTYWEYALAGRLKEFGKTDPLTIEQTLFSEKNQMGLEHAIYQKIKIEEPMVLVDAEGESFKHPKDSSWHDIMLFHERTKFKNGEAIWAIENKNSFPIDFKKLKIECPCKVFIFKEKDNVKNAVPIDIFEINNTEENKNIFLEKGKYQLVITNKKEHFLTEVEF